jgi:hypothetical protein
LEGLFVAIKAGGRMFHGMTEPQQRNVKASLPLTRLYTALSGTALPFSGWSKLRIRSLV